MRVAVHPGDEYGCGKIRLQWPGETLAAAGHDVVIEPIKNRRLHMKVENGHVTDVDVPADVDVVVMQRPTHLWLCESVGVLRGKGVSVVVDVDDDLHTIHRENVAWMFVQPDRHRQELIAGGMPPLVVDNGRTVKNPQLAAMVANLTAARPYMHSWANLDQACRDASMVTVSCERLLRHYAPHGRGRILRNYLADHYYGHERADSPNIAWPASIHNHPDDPGMIGNALARVLREQRVTFTVYGETILDLPGPPPGRTTTVGKRFALPIEPLHGGIIGIDDWPAAISQIGIGITPLAESTFNQSKSWLKPLELSGAGVPWVASPRVEYRRLHELGAGMLAKNPGEWHRALTALIKSASLREELSQAGRAVAETLRLRDHADEYMQAWADAYDVDHSVRAAQRQSAAAG